MTIASLIKTDYTVVDATTWVTKARTLICDSGTVVVLDEGKPIGLICPEDLALKPFNLVIDCIRERPRIDRYGLIEDVLILMKQSSLNSLPVYEHDNLIGIIERSSLVQYISKSLNEHKTAMQMVAHDLKNPLSSIKAISRLLEHNIQTDEDKELLDYTQQACDHALAIVGDLIESGNLENTPQRLEKTELSSLLQECITLYIKDFEAKNIKVTNNITEQECFIMADRIKLKRAICNLLSNAMKFTPPYGSVVVSAKIENKSLSLSIADSGIGIPDNLIPVIFDKFTSAKRKGTKGEASTGLGMYITKQLVEMHKGQLWLVSEVNVGTTFHIRFNEVELY